MTRIELRLFGAFRGFSENARMELEVPEGTRVRELRGLFSKRLAALRPDLPGAELVHDSVFASEQSVLGEEEPVVGRGTLAILPPVCGG